MSYPRFDIQSGQWLSRDSGWRTIHGTHIHIGAGGKIDKGPAVLRGGKSGKESSFTLDDWDADDKPAKPASTAGKASLKDAPLADFARTVQNLADDHDHGFGDNKVFISHVFEKAKKLDPSLDETTFKTRLRDAHKQKLLTVSRADLVAAMDPKHVADSHMAMLGDVNDKSDLSRSAHFILAAKKDRQQGKPMGNEITHPKSASTPETAKPASTNSGGNLASRLSDAETKARASNVPAEKSGADRLRQFGGMLESDRQPNPMAVVEALQQYARPDSSMPFKDAMNEAGKELLGRLDEGGRKAALAAIQSHVSRDAKLAPALKQFKNRHLSLSRTMPNARFINGRWVTDEPSPRFVDGAWLLCRDDCGCDDTYEPDYAELPDDAFDDAVQLARDCGAGPGGFQKGNTCAKGRYGSSDGIHTSRTTLTNIKAAGGEKTREYIDSKARRIHEYRTKDGRLFHKVDDGRANGNRFYQVHGKSTPKKPITTRAVEGAEPDAPMMPVVEPDKVREHSARDHEKRVMNAPKRVDPYAERREREDAERMESARIATEKQKAAQAKEKADIESRPEPSKMHMIEIEAELKTLKPHPKAFINKQPYHVKRREALEAERHRREVSMRQQKAQRKPDAVAAVAKYWQDRRKLESTYLSRFDVASGQWVREAKADEPIQLSMGEVTPITEWPAALAGRSTATAKGENIHEFWKTVLYDHPQFVKETPKKRQVFSITKDDIRGFAKQVKEWAKLGREISTPVDHSQSARDNLGSVVDAKVDERNGKLYLSLLHRVIGDDAKKIAQRNWASVYIDPKYIDEFGKDWGKAIIHSSFVQAPVISGLGPFVPAA